MKSNIWLLNVITKEKSTIILFICILSHPILNLIWAWSFITLTVLLILFKYEIKKKNEARWPLLLCLSWCFRQSMDNISSFPGSPLSKWYKNFFSSSQRVAMSEALRRKTDRQLGKQVRMRSILDGDPLLRVWIVVSIGNFPKEKQNHLFSTLFEFWRSLTRPHLWEVYDYSISNILSLSRPKAEDEAGTVFITRVWKW